MKRAGVDFLVQGWVVLLLCGLATPAAGQVPELRPVATIEQVWQLVADHFFDPKFNGVDWPAQRERYRKLAAACNSRDELADLANAMLAPLHASHTTYFSCDDPRHYQLLGIFEDFWPERGEDRAQYDGIGITTQSLDGRIFVSGVYDGHSASTAGVLVGDELVAVDGAPFHPLTSFRGKGGQIVQLEIRRTGSADPVTRLAVPVQRIDGRTMFETALRSSVRVFAQDGKRIGYVHVWSYAGEKYQTLLSELINSPPLSTCAALVVDLRDGWGGARPEYLQLFLPPVAELTMISRQGTQHYSGGVWNRPVGLLINRRTTSGKEVFTSAFKQRGLGPVVGERTAGAVLGGQCFPLDNGDLLYLAVADVQVDGHRLEGVGVEPTVVVERPIPYAAGRDPQLDWILKILAGS